MKSINFISLSLLVILFFACKKDDDSTSCQRLEGNWQMNSWTEDGEQFLGDTAYTITSAVDIKTLEGDQGDYEWSYDYVLGGPATVIGSYKVNESCDAVTFTPKGGTVGQTFDFHFDGENLLLEATDNGDHTILEFSK